MDGVGYYLWLAVQAFRFPMLFPPAGLLMVAGAVGGTAALPSVSADRWRQAMAAALVPLALPAAILLCGVLLAHDSAPGTLAPRWPETLVDALLMAHLPLGAALVWRLRGARWFTLCVSLGVAGYSCGAAFMSGMSVSGRWL